MAGTAREVTTEDESDTAALGAHLAGWLQRGDVLALAGPLGSGKSVFARAVVRRLTKAPDLAVPSPSFTLVQTYEPVGGPPVWHVDLYRVGDASELIELGLEEAFETAVTLIEWPERADGMLPADTLWVNITPTGASGRRLRFEGAAPWPERLTGLETARS